MKRFLTVLTVTMLAVLTLAPSALAVNAEMQVLTSQGRKYVGAGAYGEPVPTQVEDDANRDLLQSGLVYSGVISLATGTFSTLDSVLSSLTPPFRVDLVGAGAWHFAEESLSVASASAINKIATGTVVSERWNTTTPNYNLLADPTNGACNLTVNVYR